ncbi:MAG TPA: sulfotransferase [Rhizomicrobium sp.]|nr:sulfotransferase [Rhizomicrobium sp.]
MAEAIIEQVEAAVRDGQLPRALEMARRALDEGVVHPMLLNLRSYWWVQQGRDEDALADLKHAIGIAPEDIFVRNAYGVLLGRLGRWEEAMPVLKGTVEITPEWAPARQSLGWAMESTGELAEARIHYERALALDPDFAEPMVRLSSLATRRGDWEGARALANRALELQPGGYGASTTLASVAIADRDFDRAEEIVRRLVAAKPPSPLDGIFARNVLGDLRHAQGRYAQAFKAYTESNRAKFKLYAPQYDRPGVTVTDYCRWLTDYFSSASPERWSAASQTAPDDPRDGATGHVFLVGFPRSGTTLLENVLASHPGIETLEERDMLDEPMRAFLTNEADRERLAVLDEAAIAEWRARYWARVRAHGVAVAGKVFVDKYPLSTLKLPIVAKLFPKAKVLFALRDPRDVVLSCYRRSFGINSSMFEFLDLERAAKFYDAAMSLAQVCRTRLGLAWREVRNESLIADFETEARAICAFIGVDWSAEMTDFAEHAKSRSIRTPSSIQVVKGINREGVGTWKNYEAELAPVLPLLARWVEAFGYE